MLRARLSRYPRRSRLPGAPRNHSYRRVELNNRGAQLKRQSRRCSLHAVGICYSIHVTRTIYPLEGGVMAVYRRIFAARRIDSGNGGGPDDDTVTERKTK